MKKELMEVIEIYLPIDGRYFDIPADKFDEQLEDWNKMRNEYSRIYDLGAEKSVLIAPDLSPEEIVEGYQQGCKLLQRNLSGRMSQHFDRLYIPTMVQAIKNNETHTAFIFLPALAEHLGKEVGPIVLEALDSKSPIIRERALSAADHIKLLEAAPKIKAMVDDPEPEVAFLAGKIIESWGN